MKKYICVIAVMLSVTGWGAEKKSICLNMIVKDEAAVIERCLASVKGMVDYWVIVDTGSRDGTQELIKAFMKGVPGELHEKPWIDFGHNRNEALQLAKPKADYILFMDADDKLAFSEGFVMPELVADFYVVATHAKGLECILPRFVKSDLSWHWHGALHEYIMADKATEGAMLDGVEYVYLSDGARSRDPKRHEKDVAILKQAIEREPNNPRHLFYLAMTYWTMGDLPQALASYEQRAKVEVDPEEVFVSKLYIAKIQAQMQKPVEQIERSYANAYRYRPTRAEPLYHLAQLARRAGQFQKSYELSSLALLLPAQDAIFVDKWVYDYGLLVECALSAYALERYRECGEACERLLAMEGIPQAIQEEMQALQAKLDSVNVHDLLLKMVSN